MPMTQARRQNLQSKQHKPWSWKKKGLAVAGVAGAGLLARRFKLGGKLLSKFGKKGTKAKVRPSGLKERPPTPKRPNTVPPKRPAKSYDFGGGLASRKKYNVPRSPDNDRKAIQKSILRNQKKRPSKATPRKGKKIDFGPKSPPPVRKGRIGEGDRKSWETNRSDKISARIRKLSKLPETKTRNRAWDRYQLSNKLLTRNPVGIQDDLKLAARRNRKPY